MNDAQQEPATISPVMESAPDAQTVIDGRRYLYFAGTGYFGLQAHPEVIRAACEATRRYGIASATTRKGLGNNPPTLEVEKLAARFFAAQAAFYYVSGYVGNSILMSALEPAFDAAFVDEFSHYSILDAMRQIRRPVFRFRHADPEHLHAQLQSELKPGQRPMVISDGVFAASGHVAPLREYCGALDRYPGSLICLDDAHAVGILGENGRGTCEHFGFGADQVNAGMPRMGASEAVSIYCSGTLSKAIGGFGGIIAGGQSFIDALKDASPYFNGASQPPVPAAAASARALQCVMEAPELRTQLWNNAACLKKGLKHMGLAVDDTPVPIISLSIGSAANMKRIQQRLMEECICIAYMARYSGLGPEGALRIAVFATHSGPMIQQLLDAMKRVI